MQFKNFIGILILALFSFACATKQSAGQSSSPLNGKWMLKRFECPNSKAENTVASKLNGRIERKKFFYLETFSDTKGTIEQKSYPEENSEGYCEYKGELSLSEVPGHSIKTEKITDLVDRAVDVGHPTHCPPRNHGKLPRESSFEIVGDTLKIFIENQDEVAALCSGPGPLVSTLERIF